MEELLKTLDARNKYMIEAGHRIMDLADIDLTEFSGIGYERFCKLSDLMHKIWKEGLELSCFWQH